MCLAESLSQKLPSEGFDLAGSSKNISGSLKAVDDSMTTAVLNSKKVQQMLDNCPLGNRRVIRLIEYLDMWLQTPPIPKVVELDYEPNSEILLAIATAVAKNRKQLQYRRKNGHLIKFYEV